MSTTKNDELTAPTSGTTPSPVRDGKAPLPAIMPDYPPPTDPDTTKEETTTNK